jgi:hypothetical protein
MGISHLAPAGFLFLDQNSARFARRNFAQEKAWECKIIEAVQLFYIPFESWM